MKPTFLIVVLLAVVSSGVDAITVTLSTCSNPGSGIQYEADGNCHNLAGGVSYLGTVSGNTLTMSVYTSSNCGSTPATVTYTNGVCVGGGTMYSWGSGSGSGSGSGGSGGSSGSSSLEPLTESDADSQQTAFSVSFTIPFVLGGLIAAALFFRKSYHSGAAGAVPVAEIGLNSAGPTNPLYNADSPGSAPASAAATAAPSLRLQRIHRVVHVTQAVVSVYMFIAALVGLAGKHVWSAMVVVTSGGIGTGYSYVDLRTVDSCGYTGGCVSYTLRYQMSLSDQNAEYFGATFAAGIIVSALLSVALASAIFSATVTMMAAVPSLSTKVRGRVAQLTPKLIVLPWALLLLSVIVWGACLPYKYVNDQRDRVGTTSTVSIVMLSAVNMLISQSVLGLIVIIIGILVHRPTFIARHGGAPPAAVHANGAAAPVQATAAPPAGAPPGAGDWVQLAAPSGHPYWYNKVTGESSWTPPILPPAPPVAAAVPAPVAAVPAQPYPQPAPAQPYIQPAPQAQPYPPAQTYPQPAPQPQQNPPPQPQQYSQPAQSYPQAQPAQPYPQAQPAQPYPQAQPAQSYPTAQSYPQPTPQAQQSPPPQPQQYAQPAQPQPTQSYPQSPPPANQRLSQLYAPQGQQVAAQPTAQHAIYAATPENPQARSAPVQPAVQQQPTAAPSVQQPVANSALPAPWVEMAHTAPDGRPYPYYFNPTTQESRWTRPTV